MHSHRLILLACSCFVPIANVSWAVQAVPLVISLQSAIPPQLLDSADAILRGGGYRPAAAAYAQLNVRYGSNDEIFTRRFVAQIACHDWDQAAVVLASAQMAEYHISRAVLPDGLLALLLPGSHKEVADLTERLAAWVPTASDQCEAMQLMAVWLQLCGDDSRAALFFTMAEQFSQEEIVAQPYSELPPLELPAPQLSPPQPPAVKLPAPQQSPPLPLIPAPAIPASGESAPVVPEPVPAEELPTPHSKSAILSLE